ncbi:hypothetical protein PIB30_068110 [Stylosanthes scabra]|uniref:Uncharacterized protein n=1 Tax=Stylosanthes scabra TaxID=79078 RepID=A0ABU6QNJ6_9FABA|nr:hypothetical protein [Stylosanthes scabra]
MDCTRYQNSWLTRCSSESIPLKGLTIGNRLKLENIVVIGVVSVNSAFLFLPCDSVTEYRIGAELPHGGTPTTVSARFLRSIHTIVFHSALTIVILGRPSPPVVSSPISLQDLI